MKALGWQPTYGTLTRKKNSADTAPSYKTQKSEGKAYTCSEILRKVKDFDAFTSGNDPHGEHDMGSFEHYSERIMWKIDDYQGYEDLNLVLTIMFAEEYQDLRDGRL